MYMKKNPWFFWPLAVVLLLSFLLISPAPALAGKGGSKGGGTGETSGGGGKGGGKGGDSPPPIEGRFTCRASGLRINQLKGKTFEPTVANPPEDPCATDNNVFLGVNKHSTSVTVLLADTEDTTAPITSESFAVGVNVLDLVSVAVLDSVARVKSVNGVCELSGQSSVSSVTVQGKLLNLGLPVITEPLEIPIPLVGTLYLNHTLLETDRLIQRALWLKITNVLLQKTLGLESVVVGEAIADFEDGNPCAEEPPENVDKGRMTGGGKIIDGPAVTHGFVLHCDATRQPNNLQINWDGNSFHLENLTYADCSDSAGFDEGSPGAGFDTYIGEGTGRYNGVSGYYAEWKFTDQGEPGKNDTAEIYIEGPGLKLDVQGTLQQGNHQAHGD